MHSSQVRPPSFFVYHCGCPVAMPTKLGFQCNLQQNWHFKGWCSAHAAGSPDPDPGLQGGQPAHCRHNPGAARFAWLQCCPAACSGGCQRQPGASGLLATLCALAGHPAHSGCTQSDSYYDQAGDLPRLQPDGHHIILSEANTQKAFRAAELRLQANWQCNRSRNCKSASTPEVEVL